MRKLVIYGLCLLVLVGGLFWMGARAGSPSKPPQHQTFILSPCYKVVLPQSAQKSDIDRYMTLFSWEQGGRYSVVMFLSEGAQMVDKYKRVLIENQRQAGYVLLTETPFATNEGVQGLQLTFRTPSQPERLREWVVIPCPTNPQLYLNAYWHTNTTHSVTVRAEMYRWLQAVQIVSED